MNKKQSFEVELCSINKIDNNPTIKNCSWILHDFEINLNNTKISKEVAQKSLDSLLNQPIVCKYIPVSEPNADDDDFSGHEAHLAELRDGSVCISTDTIAVGVFTSPAYISTIKDKDGIDKEVVMGDGVLWSSRYPNIVDLISDMWDKGTPLKSSMEVLYDEYLYKEGVQHIQNFLYEGHCILGSKTNIVHPAYDVSQLAKFQKLVAEAISKEKLIAETAVDSLDLTIDIKKNKEENEMKMFKKVFEISHDDVRSLLYTALQPTLSEEDYNYGWIVEVYDTYFILSVKDGYEKYNYTRTEEAVTVDFESVTKVKEKSEWIEVVAETASTDTSTAYAELKVELETANTALNSANETLEATTVSLTETKTELENVMTQFNTATDKLTSLNSEVDSLKTYKEQLEQIETDKNLNEKMTYYCSKFESVNSKVLFETEEIQNLVKLTVNENEEGLKAKVMLSEKLVELVQPVTVTKPLIREHASKLGNLLPNTSSFDDKYKE